MSKKGVKGGFMSARLRKNKREERGVVGRVEGGGNKGG